MDINELMMFSNSNEGSNLLVLTGSKDSRLSCQKINEKNQSVWEDRNLLCSKVMHDLLESGKVKNSYVCLDEVITLLFKDLFIFNIYFHSTYLNSKIVSGFPAYIGVYCKRRYIKSPNLIKPCLMSLVPNEVLKDNFDQLKKYMQLQSDSYKKLNLPQHHELKTDINNIIENITYESLVKKIEIHREKIKLIK